MVRMCVDCGHVRVLSSLKSCPFTCRDKCCQCGGEMYESRMHTPASNCSSNSMASCGPAPSISGQNDDFEMQLTRRLAEFQAARNDVNGDDNGIDQGVTARIEKVSQWRQGIAELFDDEADDSGIEDEPNRKEPDQLQEANYGSRGHQSGEYSDVRPSSSGDKESNGDNHENTGALIGFVGEPSLLSTAPRIKGQNTNRKLDSGRFSTMRLR
ncbi:hypothetical protein F5Y04DRAFT_151986 [Hypomontagnella monticulosa]|nr:hypothetical protein F5Y04DRAFT_151986 [Hypomontagnella monticulosa]